MRWNPTRNWPNKDCMRWNHRKGDRPRGKGKPGPKGGFLGKGIARNGGARTIYPEVRKGCQKGSLNTFWNTTCIDPSREEQFTEHLENNKHRKINTLRQQAMSKLRKSGPRVDKQWYAHRIDC